MYVHVSSTWPLSHASLTTWNRIALSGLDDLPSITGFTRRRRIDMDSNRPSGSTLESKWRDIQPTEAMQRRSEITSGQATPPQVLQASENLQVAVAEQEGSLVVTDRAPSPVIELCLNPECPEAQAVAAIDMADTGGSDGGNGQVLDDLRSNNHSSVRTKAAKYLPEEVQEMIISRMPFPSLFTARALSRTWYYKFSFPLVNTSSVIALPCDSFQDHVRKASAKWASFCPVFLSRKQMVGFDMTLLKWRTVVMFPEHLHAANPATICYAGSLICSVSISTRWTDLDELLYDEKQEISWCSISVTNVFTKNVRELPEISKYHSINPYNCRLILTGSDSYKVIVIDLDSTVRNHGGLLNEQNLYAHIYDSTSRTWIIECKITKPDHVDFSSFHRFFLSAAFVDGTFYGLDGYPRGAMLTLCTYNIKNNTWSSIFILHGILEMTKLCEEGLGGSAAVLFCGGKFILCVCSPLAMQKSKIDLDPELCVFCTRPNSIVICEVDIESSEFKLVSMGPDKGMAGLGRQTLADSASPLEFMRFSAHGNVLYFGRMSSSCPVLTFNLCNSQWGCLPAAARYELGSAQETTWGVGAFEPGLNPFMIA